MCYFSFHSNFKLYNISNHLFHLLFQVNLLKLSKDAGNDNNDLAVQEKKSLMSDDAIYEDVPDELDFQHLPPYRAAFYKNLGSVS